MSIDERRFLNSYLFWQRLQSRYGNRDFFISSLFNSFQDVVVEIEVLYNGFEDKLKIKHSIRYQIFISWKNNVYNRYIESAPSYAKEYSSSYDSSSIDE